MRFYVTESLRPVEIGSITIAIGVSETSLMIPQGQSSFKHYTFCSLNCTKVCVQHNFLNHHFTFSISLKRVSRSMTAFCMNICEAKASESGISVVIQNWNRYLKTIITISIINKSAMRLDKSLFYNRTPF